MKVLLETQNFEANKNVKTINRSPINRVEITDIQFKNLRVVKRKEFIQDTLNYSLITLYKAGKWIKSKLTYFKNGKVSQTIRSKANDNMVR